jgi:hypothetical protein
VAPATTASLLVNCPNIMMGGAVLVFMYVMSPSSPHFRLFEMRCRPLELFDRRGLPICHVPQKMQRYAFVCQPRPRAARATPSATSRLAY